jgi:hypothetical protein
MDDKLEAIKPATRAAIAELLTELKMLEKEDPVAIERVSRLFEKQHRDAFLAKYVRAMLPARFDVESFEALLTGAAAMPDSNGAADTSGSRKPSARGAYESLRQQVDRAAEESQRQRDKFALAEAREATLRRELAEAEAFLRSTVVLRVLDHFSKALTAPFMLGPVWTLVRSISGYLQLDRGYEASLIGDARARYEQHCADRKDTAAEIVKYLDRYCSDPAFEIALHDAILAAGRQHDAPVKRELEMRNYASEPLSKYAKVPTRKTEARRTEVRPGARLSDRADVLAGIPDAIRDDGDTDTQEVETAPEDSAPPADLSDRPW